MILCCSVQQSAAKAQHKAFQSYFSPSATNEDKAVQFPSPAADEETAKIAPRATDPGWTLLNGKTQVIAG